MSHDIMLGYKLIADGMHDPEIKKLSPQLGCVEGSPVVKSLGIIAP